MERPYQICTRCLIDTVQTHVTFDEEGVCTLCRWYDRRVARYRAEGTYGEARFREELAAMRSAGAGRDYDCLLGLSGGLDSTYMAHLCHHLGLRPLCVHFDNGWDSERAIRNIERAIRKYGFDYRTYVIDWEEFRDLQRSFFKASVVDIELLTDQAIFGSLYRIGAEEGIRCILSGGNFVSEATLPIGWNHDKSDVLNIFAIQNRFGTRPIADFPLLDPATRARYDRLGFRWVELLNYQPYVVRDARRVLEQELGWEDPGWKHFESVFTRFYQGWFLPEKFGVDKRRAHLSNLVWSGQLTRDEALARLGEPCYSEAQVREDRDYVLKKLGFTEEEFQEILATPPRSHFDFPSMAVPHDWYKP
jgi:N-acetyl sugar amidotransferase